MYLHIKIAKLVTDDERENVIRDIRDMSSNSEIRDMV